MKVAADGKPLVGIRFAMLGVRPRNPTTTFDVDAVAGTDLVLPGEGLSTSPDPNSRQPRRGESVFEIETDELSPDLAPNPDKPGHVLLEPSRSMTLDDFQQALADTRDLWQQVQ
ncbi:MAG TPA: hypothetical protein VM529_09140 [Gemmata sp.]|nr:hypothetical protein [Gemmata sp.]